jgi:hypothetical protein
MRGFHRRDWDGQALLDAGQYAYRPGDGWYACTPNGLQANLSAHDVTYHEDDKTITVDGLLRVYNASGEAVGWHGDIIRGVWREC